MDNAEIEKRVKQYFSDACSRLNRVRYAQESAYVDALIGRLDGVLDFGEGNGSIEFTPTVVADRGPGSAESLYGADFSIVFKSQNVEVPISKAILAQAKNDDVDTMPKEEVTRLREQCKKMSRFTNEYIVLEAPKMAGAVPTIRLGTSGTNAWGKIRMGLDEYFLELVLSCKHGDRRPEFIRGVASSNLSGLTVDVNGLEYTPTPKPRKRRENKPGNTP
ncbi:hypothetical protein [Vibrio furnissii]|uniref:hypothetical protein n=1 Tax=Vibrio furnissii TaxID=29494 RepID=UPI002573BEA6|nr:hypothetical protein [Vibrio furnissii]WJG22002.1 hypothetical protein QSU95_02180 [Vibrio furnissii]